MPIEYHFLSACPSWLPLELDRATQAPPGLHVAGDQTAARAELEHRQTDVRANRLLKRRCIRHARKQRIQFDLISEKNTDIW